MSTILEQTMSLSFSKALLSSSTTIPLFLHTKFSNLSLQTRKHTPTIIRMGGGPRTYPGGVSKWQWKRMQAKKAKQLLKARLCRERQIYEMRKRAELKAAVSELERPWEAVERAPNLFSVTADEQLKVLADRFQKPGGFDLWTERDGPQLFETPDGLPSARFFPKGVVHSIKPYGRVNNNGNSEYGSDSEDGVKSGADSLEAEPEWRGEKRRGGKWRKRNGQVRFDRKQRGSGGEKLKDMRGEVYDTRLQHNGTCAFQEKNGGFDANYEVKEAEFEELE